MYVMCQLVVTLVYDNEMFVVDVTSERICVCVCSIEYILDLPISSPTTKRTYQGE